VFAELLSCNDAKFAREKRIFVAALSPEEISYKIGFFLNPESRHASLPAPASRPDRQRRTRIVPGANKSALFTKQTNGGQSAAKSACCAAMLRRTARHRSEVVGVDNADVGALARAKRPPPYSHFIHLKKKYGSTAASSINAMAKG
jgi:hypothetical protein